MLLRRSVRRVQLIATFLITILSSRPWWRLIGQRRQITSRGKLSKTLITHDKWTPLLHLWWLVALPRWVGFSLSIEQSLLEHMKLFTWLLFTQVIVKLSHISTKIGKHRDISNGLTVVISLTSLSVLVDLLDDRVLNFAQILAASPIYVSIFGLVNQNFVG